MELCPDWPQKRPLKSIYKTNEILTFWLQRPSDVAICVARACFFFCRNDAYVSLKTKFSREKLTFEGVITHLELRSPMFGEFCICFFYRNFNRIDEIAGGFPSQVDFRKSSHFMFKLSMLQKAPKRRSPNTFNYKLT